MDPETRKELRELPRLSREVLISLNETMKVLAQVSLSSPEFKIALRNSKEANEDARELLAKQRAVIRAFKGN
jgi:hypothetical protein